MAKIRKRANTSNNTTSEEEPVLTKTVFKQQPESDGDSSSSDEGPEWTADDEKAFLKTLGALKGKTESIYDAKQNFWEDKAESAKTSAQSNKKEKQKKMFLKDYERKLVLEKDGQIEESDEEAEEQDYEPGYFEEQDAIKKQFKAALEEIEEDDGDSLFKKREKNVETKDKEEADYYDWIKNKNKNVKVGKEIESLKEVWDNPQLEDDDKFLRDYLLNKQYETDGNADIPTYEEIIDEDEDEEQLQRERDYERKYNFRYEEPDQEFIKQYPRSVSESIRKDEKKTKRKEQRVTKRQAKLKEKKEKITVLKKKQKETKNKIEDKLRRLKEITGEDIPLSLDDLNKDFDPAEYDKLMQDMFDKKYYGDDVNYDEDEKKPVFSDLDDFDDDYDQVSKKEPKKKVLKKKAVRKAEEGDEEEVDVKEEEDDAQDVGDAGESVSHRRKESKRKLKRKQQLEESRKKKPLFDPSERTFEEYLNEYYSMEFEDLIDDQPTKFRYRSVIPNNFGLTADEILKADEKDLNVWAPVRKAISYRSDEQELYDVHAYERKARNSMMKHKVLASLNKREEEEPEDGDEGVTKKKTKKTKKSLEKAKVSQVEHDGTEEHEHEAEADNYVEADVAEAEVANTQLPPKKAPRTRKKKNASVANGALPTKQTDQDTTQNKAPIKRKQPSKDAPAMEAKKQKVSLPVVTDERLKAYGINPKKFKNHMRYRKKKTEGEPTPV